MENDDLKYNGCCGSFEGLYTFLRQLRFMGWGILVLESKLQGKSLLRGLMLRRWELLGLLRSRLWLGILGWISYWSISNKIMY